MSVPSVTQYFPFSSQYTTWEEWNGNLIMYFGSEPIGVSVDTNWQAGATQIMGLPTFAAYPVSSPDSFDNWQDWADNFTQILNGPSR
jgi:hypothetical protein